MEREFKDGWVDPNTNELILGDAGISYVEKFIDYSYAFYDKFMDAITESDQPSIEITPAMKESVMYEGQPLFTARKGKNACRAVEVKPI